MSVSEKIVNLLIANPAQCSFANIKTITNPCRPSKKSEALLRQLFPTHTAIIKVGSRNVSIGNTYSAAIDNRLQKINAFENVCIAGVEYNAEQRSWAERITNGLIQHKGNKQMYVEYYYLNANKSTYVYKWEDGTELTNDELTIAKDQLFPPVSASKKQEAFGLTDENQIKVNIVKIENVIALNAFGASIE